jgi:hypothetical protein
MCLPFVTNVSVVTVSYCAKYALFWCTDMHYRRVEPESLLSCSQDPVSWSRNFPPFMEPESLLPCPHDFVTSPSPDSVQSSPHTYFL